MARKIDAQTEVRIVALIARGDPYTSIQSALKEDGIDISLSAITDVKQRNTSALEQIKSSLAVHETSKATRILSKARKQIEDALDSNEQYQKDLDMLKQAYEDGDIDIKEYLHEKDKLYRTNFISIKDLTTVSKEMFNQSQLESGKPTTITENPEENKKNLMILLRAIQAGDEIGMLHGIFPDA